MRDGRKVMVMGCVAREEKGGDRWTVGDGDRGTAFRFWDICMAMRGDRKSLWWMGGPTRGYKGGRDVDNDRTRARDARRRGLAERMWMRKFRKAASETGEEEAGGGWRRRERHRVEGVFTQTSCHNRSWLLSLTVWTNLTHTSQDAEGRGFKRGGGKEMKIWKWK